MGEYGGVRIVDKHGTDASQVPKLEGLITSGNRLEAYENSLGFSAELLDGQRVLNFGCGASNIGQELELQGLSSRVVDVDLQSDLSITPDQPIRWILSLPIRGLMRVVDTSHPLYKKLVTVNRYLSGTDGRTFVQADGRSLPFADDTFGTVLALWSTYQIPLEARKQVYRELMRMGEYVHIAPVFQVDYDMLVELANECDFEIVASHRVSWRDLPFRFKNKEDYQKYIDGVSYEERVERPTVRDSKVKITLLGRSANGEGGHVMVLRRKKDNKNQE